MIIGWIKDTVLSENDVLITKQEVCEIFNNFFANVAKYIGKNQINVDGDHPSILEIKNNHPELLEINSTASLFLQ
jgi:hypothetical protein